MKGAIILLAFFIIFVSASLLIPVPMFPGSFFCLLIGEAVSQYDEFLSALFNGIFYGAVLWLVFAIISRRIEEEK